jgi:spoIIIJ-associated protein
VAVESELGNEASSESKEADEIQPAASLEEQADAAADFVEELLGYMGVDAIAEPTERHGRMYVDILDATPDVLASLIGHHGQTLDAIQELTRSVVGRRLGERVLVVVDVNDYRKRRESQVERQAEQACERALESGDEIELDPMNPLERKIAHYTVARVPGVESFSRGDEPERRVVVRRV